MTHGGDYHGQAGEGGGCACMLTHVSAATRAGSERKHLPMANAQCSDYSFCFRVMWVAIDKKSLRLTPHRRI